MAFHPPSTPCSPLSPGPKARGCSPRSLLRALSHSHQTPALHSPPPPPHSNSPYAQPQTLPLQPCFFEDVEKATDTRPRPDPDSISRVLLHSPIVPGPTPPLPSPLHPCTSTAPSNKCRRSMSAWRFFGVPDDPTSPSPLSLPTPNISYSLLRARPSGLTAGMHSSSFLTQTGALDIVSSNAKLESLLA